MFPTRHKFLLLTLLIVLLSGSPGESSYCNWFNQVTESVCYYDSLGNSSCTYETSTDIYCVGSGTGGNGTYVPYFPNYGWGGWVGFPQARDLTLEERQALNYAKNKAVKALESIPECANLPAEFGLGPGIDLIDLIQNRIRFRNWQGHSYCDSFAAFTHPHSTYVYLCDRWMNLSRRNQARVIVHESLHSAGLGEDPPSSAEINGRVKDRCGL